MNRRPTDLRRYVLVRNLKRYVKAHESNAPSNENQESVAPQQESIADPNVTKEILDPPTEKQETIDRAVIKQETADPSNFKQDSTLACFNSEKITLSSSPSDSVDESSSTNESATSKDTDLNTSAFAIVASLFKPRKKCKKGITKAKIVVKGSKCKKQPSSSIKEKVSVTRKPRSLFSLFKNRKEKRNNMLDSKINDSCSSVSSNPETTSQSCQTDITWPDDGYNDLQRSNQVLQESNRLLIENLSTLIQNYNSNPVSTQPPGICTDTYGSESGNYNVAPQPNYSGSIETEPKSTIRARSNASKLHRSQTLMESCKSYRICTRSKSMLNTERQCTPIRTYSKTGSNFLPSSPYQLRSTILKDLSINTNHGINRRSSMPERIKDPGPMRPLLRRRSNNIFDYNHGSVSYPIQSPTDHNYQKPLSENFPLNKVRKTLVRRSSMPDRVPKPQVNFQLRSAVQRRNTLSYHGSCNNKQNEYNCSMRFQDLPKEAFY